MDKSIIFYTLEALLLLTAGRVIYLAKKAKDENKSFLETAKASVKGMLLGMVAEAESEWGGGTGAFKRAYVLNKVLNSSFYISLPAYVKIILNADFIGGLIDSVVELLLKPLMEDNEKAAGKITDKAGT